MSDTDTRAALDAALEQYRAAPMGSSDRTTVDRAITAHVEAEIARRLAAAPEVEAAIAKYGVQAAGGADTTSAESDLRAAIAADKARAVAVACPTPDEARRLVDALWRALAGDVGIPPRRGKTAAITARTALLRALGVEA